MKKRKKMNYRKSKKLFSKTAAKSNPKNARPIVMRGGIRF